MGGTKGHMKNYWKNRLGWWCCLLMRNDVIIKMKNEEEREEEMRVLIKRK